MLKIIKICLLMLIVFCMGCPNVTDDTRDDYPQFPCPHPKASASYNIPWATFKRSRSSLEKVARQIQTALEANGYYELRWFSVKDGFAVMTRMEQFQKNGKSLSGRDRWSEEIHVPFWDSLWGQKKGFFRCIVFIVTTEVLKGTRTKFDIARLNGLFSRGVQAGFPRGLASIPFANSHNCIALIYEFEKYPESSGMIFNTGSELQGKTHLEKAGILKALKEKNDRKQK